MYEVRFLAHNQPTAPGVSRTRLVSTHDTIEAARAAARAYGKDAADVIHDRNAISAHAGDGVAVYVDGFTLWSEFYVEEVQ